MKEAVLVTGGAGFIGSTFAGRMLDKGHRVIVFDSFVRRGVEFNARNLEGAEIIRGDVRFSNDFDKVSGQIDWVFHCAANPGIKWSIEHPEFDFDTNAKGTLNVLQFAKKKNASVVYCSTNKVYDGDKINSIPLVETKTRYTYDPKSGFENGIPTDFPIDGGHHTPYGVSKLAGDLLCQEWSQGMGVTTIVNRMSCISGRNSMGVEDQNWVAWFVLSSLLNRPINVFGDGKQVRDVLDGEDLVELVEKEFVNMNDLQGSVFNVGGGPKNTLSLLECFELIEREVNVKLKKSFHDWRVADQKCYVSDISKVCKYTSWQPKTEPVTLIKNIHLWLKDHPEILDFYSKHNIK